MKHSQWRQVVALACSLLALAPIALGASAFAVTPVTPAEPVLAAAPAPTLASAPAKVKQETVPTPMPAAPPEQAHGTTNHIAPLGDNAPPTDAPVGHARDEQAHVREELPHLNIAVDMLALLTTVLAIISGYTVYKSHRDASEAKRTAESTLSEAQKTLAEAKSVSTACGGIMTSLQTHHDTLVKDLVNTTASYERALAEKSTSLEGALERTRATFETKMADELDSFRLALHESGTVRRSKIRLMELLAGEAPDADQVFPLLTDILEFPDQQSIEVYERLLEVFPDDKQILAKVKLGLSTFRERHFNNTHRRRV